MAALNIVNLPRITASQLRSFLLSPSAASSLSIIDVRDSDYIGGSSHVPTSTHDTALTELARTLQDKKLVVFHCMLSQQRGPGSALRYARERERLLKNVEGGGGGAVAVGVDVLQGAEADALLGVQPGKQIVAVLERGFEGWVLSGYGGDELLTQGFLKDLWDGYD